MCMKMTFRWYGPDDPVTLDNIRQIPGMTGVVTAVYSVPVGSMAGRRNPEIKAESRRKKDLRWKSSKCSFMRISS